MKHTNALNIYLCLYNRYARYIFFSANISKVLLSKKYEVLGKIRKGITQGVTFELSLKRDDINHATIRTQVSKQSKQPQQKTSAEQCLKSLQKARRLEKNKKILTEDETRVKVLPDYILQGVGSFEFRLPFITKIKGVRCKATGKF